MQWTTPLFCTNYVDKFVQNAEKDLQLIDLYR